MPNDIRDALEIQIREYTEHAFDTASTSTLMALRRLLIDLGSNIEFGDAIADYLGLPFDNSPGMPYDGDTAEGDAGAIGSASIAFVPTAEFSAQMQGNTAQVSQS